MSAATSRSNGSSIPPHLTTKEFFEVANRHLTTNGVLAYNVIGQIQGWKADIVGGIYRTMKEVFPQVYLFPAKSSMNVVIVATKSSQPLDPATILNNQPKGAVRTVQQRFRNRNAFLFVRVEQGRFCPVLNH